MIPAYRKQLVNKFKPSRKNRASNWDMRDSITLPEFCNATKGPNDGMRIGDFGTAHAQIAKMKKGETAHIREFLAPERWGTRKRPKSQPQILSAFTKAWAAGLLVGIEPVPDTAGEMWRRK